MAKFSIIVAIVLSWLIGPLPLIIARRRKHRNALAITVLNILTVSPFLLIISTFIISRMLPHTSADLTQLEMILAIWVVPALQLASIGWLVSLIWSLTVPRN